MAAGGAFLFVLGLELLVISLALDLNPMLVWFGVSLAPIGAAALVYGLAARE